MTNRHRAEQRHFGTQHLNDDLKGRSVRGGAVTIATQVSGLLLKVAALVVLARLLVPADFGLIAMVMAFTSVFGRFQSLGLPSATVQRESINHQQVSTLLWINVGVGALMMLLTIISAPAIAWFYGEPRLVPVAMALSTTFALTGLTVQHRALLRRQMRFVAISAMNQVGLAAGLGAGIVLAWTGAGYWSLVGMTVTTAGTEAVLAWSCCRWRPGWPSRASGVGSMLAFGGNLAGSSILDRIWQCADQMLIGLVCGAGPLGLYSKSQSILNLARFQIQIPLSKIALPTLSRLQNDPDRFRKYYQTGITVVFALGMPIAAFAWANADSIVVTALGPAWLEATALLRVLAPAAFLGTFQAALSWVLLPTGRTDRQIRLVAARTVLTMLAFAVGIRWGPLGVAAAFSMARLVLFIPELRYAMAGTPVGLSTVGQAAWRPASTSLAAAAGLVAVAAWLPVPEGGMVRFVIEAATFGGLYAMAWLVIPGGPRVLQTLAEPLRHLWPRRSLATGIYLDRTDHSPKFAPRLRSLHPRSPDQGFATSPLAIESLTSVCTDQDFPQRGEPLALIRQLCEKLNAQGVRYVHWKSNINIHQALSGIDDLDLLVDREQTCVFFEVLHQLGFREVVDRPSRQIPGIHHLYGYDAASGQTVHVHAHFQLVLGHDMTKNYHLPLERAVLSSAQRDRLLPIASPSVELILYSLRMLLKFNRLHNPLRKIDMLQNHRELEYLEHLADEQAIDQILQHDLPSVDRALLDACRQAARPGVPNQLRAQVQRRLHRALRPYARRSRPLDRWLKLARTAIRLIEVRLRIPKRKKRFSNGGLIVAVVGGDGAGKTTIVQHLAQHFGRFVATETAHLGKPRRDLLSHTARLVYRADKLGRRVLAATGLTTSGTDHPTLLKWKQFCTARDRYRAYGRARRAATAGSIVLCDRWPLPGLTLMDGPRPVDETTLSAEGQLTGWLRRQEIRLHHQIVRPDALVVLRVDPEIAVARKTDEHPDHVRPRSTQVWQFDWQTLDAQVVDASRPLEQVVSQVLQASWRALGAAPPDSEHPTPALRVAS